MESSRDWKTVNVRLNRCTSFPCMHTKDSAGSCDAAGRSVLANAQSGKICMPIRMIQQRSSKQLLLFTERCPQQMNWPSEDGTNCLTFMSECVLDRLVRRGPKQLGWTHRWLLRMEKLRRRMLMLSQPGPMMTLTMSLWHCSSRAGCVSAPSKPSVPHLLLLLRNTCGSLHHDIHSHTLKQNSAAKHGLSEGSRSMKAGSHSNTSMLGVRVQVTKK